MIVQGKYNSADIKTANFDETTRQQVSDICNQPWSEGSSIKIMPDCHAGAGCVIGTTMTIKDCVNPSMVGVDIGCFTGDTKVQLTDGRSLSFVELIEDKDKRHFGYAIDETGAIQITELTFPRKIKNVDDIIELELDNGQKIKCTLDHKFLLRNNTYKEAQELKVGDALMPFDVKKRGDIQESLAPKDSNFLYNAPKYLCVLNPKTDTYKYVHRLSDKYNLRNHVYEPEKYKTLRHHIDFNLLNNDPTNITNIGYKEHRLIHAMHIKESNKEGITGFKRAEELHPGQARASSIKRAKSTWHGGNADKNRLNASIRFKERNTSGDVNTPRQCEASSIRRTEWNKTSGKSFKERNSEQTFQNAQKFSRIKRCCVKCLDIFGEINPETYNKTTKYFYKYSYFDKAQKFISSLGMDITQINEKSEYKNHSVAGIKYIKGYFSVYCLTSSEFGNFALSSGVFVHNCGMLLADLGKIDLDLKALDEFIHGNIPYGPNIHDDEQVFLTDLFQLACASSLKGKMNRFNRSCGTLGGGNHFIEVDEDEDGNKYLIIHSGSRNLGLQVANHYTNKTTVFGESIQEGIDRLKREGKKDQIQSYLAGRKSEPIDKALCCVYGQDMADYLHDEDICVSFAKENRRHMADAILNHLGINLRESAFLETIHNYVDTESMTIRKGAIRALKGETVIIPMNMRDGTLICVGKGTEDWNCSAPHGAGRVLSRSQARKEIALGDFKEAMKGIYSTSVDNSTIDESPFAYKPAEEIKEYIRDTVDIVKVLKPIYNFKAHTPDPEEEQAL